MFIQTEPTPNPATLKFLPGRVVMEQGVFEAQDEAAAAPSPLARSLLSIPGVSGVFFGSDFISVTKKSGDWANLKPAVLGTIMEHFVAGVPLFEDTIDPDSVVTEEFFDPADAEIVRTIKELLEQRVRPAVANDGGDIIFRGFRDGIVYLAMHGACSGCPSSTATLRFGIQNLLRHFIPEVLEVQPV
ncbi:MAG: NifU family protein [Methylobacteriaceae bacterium]|jgi:Fe-S cluster biogenesis protein NfuA|nr:NifU family protein [Methylobacteriaceae bacterium]